MSQLTDLEIMEQIRVGNTNSYSLLVDRYKYMVFTAAVRMLKNKEDAEEVAQDVFLSVYKSLDNFRGDSKVSTWLYRITYNKCLDHMKRKSSRPLAGTEDISESYDIGFMDKNMEALEQLERKNMVRSAISELPEEEALLITMFYLDELSLREIASVTGDSSNTVKVRLYRSRKRLMVLLKNKMEPEIVRNYERR